MVTFSLRRHQQGVVLIMALVILVLVTLVGVSTVRGTTIEEKMAGNARDRDKAFQAAEAAVRACLAMLNTDPALYTSTKLAPVAATAVPPTPHWEVDANWATGSANSYAVTMTGAGLAANPRCLVEDLGGGVTFRVTGRAVGGSPDSVAMLQATYSRD